MIRRRCVNCNSSHMRSASKCKCSPLTCIFFHLGRGEGVAGYKRSSLKSNNPSGSQSRALFPMALLQWFWEKWTLLTESVWVFSPSLSTENRSRNLLSCGRGARNPAWVGINKNIYISPPCRKKNPKHIHIWICRISRRCSWPIALQGNPPGARQMRTPEAEADSTLQNLSLLQSFHFLYSG